MVMKKNYVYTTITLSLVCTTYSLSWYRRVHHCIIRYSFTFSSGSITLAHSHYRYRVQDALNLARHNRCLIGDVLLGYKPEALEQLQGLYEPAMWTQTGVII